MARLRKNQIFVVGEVVRPGSYQVSAAGIGIDRALRGRGPSEQGSFRQIIFAAAAPIVDSVDLYDISCWKATAGATSGCRMVTWSLSPCMAPASNHRRGGSARHLRARSGRNAA